MVKLVMVLSEYGPTILLVVAHIPTPRYVHGRFWLSQWMTTAILYSHLQHQASTPKARDPTTNNRTFEPTLRWLLMDRIFRTMAFLVKTGRNNNIVKLCEAAKLLGFHHQILQSQHPVAAMHPFTSWSPEQQGELIAFCSALVPSKPPLVVFQYWVMPGTTIW